MNGENGGDDDRLVGRGGLKLEAALDRFQLDDAVRGRLAVDVGASTGGFTQVLLERGATAVWCVDVGRGQLHERLRRDPRVHNLEATDWKRLSLSEAAGPFDFFTVDVSFVAARNMLRALAFRLRPGAAGVVLVKPQFELPDHLVRRGDVSDPTLRRQAMDRFRDKAESLGFRVLAHVDSPVAGGEGTIEILAHLVFDGRSEKLPQPGEKRPVPAPADHAARSRSRPQSKGVGSTTTSLATRDWFAVVAPGAEEVAAREVAQTLGDVGARAVHGGVEWRGSFAQAMRANLHLRIPTRVLLRAGTVRAREFGKLRHLLAKLPWEDFVAPAAPVRVTVSATHCRLYHTGAVEEAVRAAMGDRLGAAPPKPAPAAISAAPLQAAAPPAAAGPAEHAIDALVLVRGVDDSWTISIDSSGERLHRRGWRTETGEAPLRESLAAAVLALAEWEPTMALLDPMCGAGTIPIEASTIALGMPPGLQRRFAFENWPSWDASHRQEWARLRQTAASAIREGLPAPIVASDQDGAALAAARHNSTRAGVDAHVTFTERRLADAQPPAPTGLFVANPPYGERLGRRRELPALYREMGAILRHRFRGWRAAVVVPDVRLASAFRLPVTASHPLIHGGLRVTVLRFG